MSPIAMGRSVGWTLQIEYIAPQEIRLNGEGEEPAAGQEGGEAPEDGRGEEGWGQASGREDPASAE